MSKRFNVPQDQI